MAVSSPKHRFNPRATLYSPPPSLTSKRRVVQMRYSPGSKRSITSPKLTRSQRQVSFCLMLKDISTSAPQPAAVHGENMPVYIIARRGAQVYRRARDVLWLSPSRRGNPFEKLTAANGIRAQSRSVVRGHV